MSERDELLKRLESLAQAQLDSEGELEAQRKLERDATGALAKDVADLTEEVEHGELELFGLEEQLKELKEALRRAK
ncbi:MAG: hypothetical protein JNM17_12605 [Archangium sp.]|nr:hypothetical protein [Archangium sp.]